MSNTIEEVLDNNIGISNIALHDYLRDRGIRATVFKPNERVQDIQNIFGSNKTFSQGSDTMSNIGEIFVNISSKNFTKLTDGFEAEVTILQPDDNMKLEQNDHLSISYLGKVRKFKVDGIIESLGKVRKIKLILI